MNELKINGQLRNKLFFIVIYNFSLVTRDDNVAPRVFKIRKNCLPGIDYCAMVLKTPQFICFPIAEGVTKTIAHL